MKVLVLLAGLGVLFTVTGCEGEPEHHHNQGYGGSYEGPANSDYGRGEYLGYPDYPQYRH